MTSSSDRAFTRVVRWTALSTVVKIGQGLLVNKLLAVKFGLGGFGQASNMISLMSYLDALAGAGIVNGINKYVAEFHDNPQQLRSLLGTASTIILTASTLTALVLVGAAQPMNHLLGTPAESLWLIKSTALIQFAVAGANLLRAMLKGEGHAIGNSLSLIGGSLLGLITYWLGIRHWGYQGALVSVALMPAWTLIPASIVFYRQIPIPIQWLTPTWEGSLARSLFTFSLMSFTNSILGLIALIIVRTLLTADYGGVEVGLWQAMRRFSDIYFQITTSFLSVYLLPLLSRSQKKPEIVQAMGHTLRFILLLAIGSSLLLWLLRDWLILRLFSYQFSAMRDLCAWQLSGDIFRIGSAVFMSLILGKALLTAHLLSELLIFLLTLLFSYQFIPTQGAIGATQAHLATHLIYFTLCLLIGVYYTQRA